MITIGVDIGTTTITCVAWDFDKRAIVACQTVANLADITSETDKKRGRSEWDAEQMVVGAIRCLRKTVDQLGDLSQSVAGVGITGQQHGVVILDELRQPVTPLVNWQDRRGEESVDGERSYVQLARDELGEAAPQRMGCRIAPGYMGLTLFWWQQRNELPRQGTSCFIVDYFAATLTGQPPHSDSTMGASSGLLNVAQRQWDREAIDALNLPAELFPPLSEPTTQLGKLTTSAAEETGLPAGTPIFVAMGDNQAAFVGSVGDPSRSLLINVGTGGQVAGRCDHFVYQAPLETRPFPVSGNLLVNAGLCGGRSYAALERMFRLVGQQLYGIESPPALFSRMNELAEQIDSGSNGLICSPLFTGTRGEPHLRASFSGADPENFTPAHLVRALLEGMVEVFHEGAIIIEAAAGKKYERLVGAGNGLRENQVLADMLIKRLGRQFSLPQHREEAAVGASLVAGVGSGICADLADAGRQL